MNVCCHCEPTQKCVKIFQSLFCNLHINQWLFFPVVSLFYRVSVTPVVAGTLVKKGFKVQVESGAGLNAKFRDADYEAAGASIVDGRKAFETGT